MTPVYDLDADIDFEDSDPSKWRDLPDSDRTEDDEDIPTPRHVKVVLGFDPDEEDWD